MIRSPTGSLREETGIGAGGRATLASATGAAVVLAITETETAGFTSAGRASAGRTSASLTSAGFNVASTGRGRGNGLAAATGAVVPNIGDGWCPACMNIALATMALTAAKAI